MLYHVICFSDNTVIVKFFFGKATIFNLSNSLSINISVGTDIGHGYNVQTVELNLFEKNTRKISRISILTVSYFIFKSIIMLILHSCF